MLWENDVEFKVLIATPQHKIRLPSFILMMTQNLPWISQYSNRICFPLACVITKAASTHCPSEVRWYDYSQTILGQAASNYFHVIVRRVALSFYDTIHKTLLRRMQWCMSNKNKNIGTSINIYIYIKSLRWIHAHVCVILFPNGCVLIMVCLYDKLNLKLGEVWVITSHINYAADTYPS